MAVQGSRSLYGAKGWTETYECATELYRKAGVDIAILEVLRQNDKAIELIVRSGTSSSKTLIFLQRTDALRENPFQPNSESTYHLKHGIPHDVRLLPFYRSMSPWQTQWASVPDGESLTVLNPAEKPLDMPSTSVLLTKQVISFPLHFCSARQHRGLIDGDEFFGLHCPICLPPSI